MPLKCEDNLQRYIYFFFSKSLPFFLFRVAKDILSPEDYLELENQYKEQEEEKQKLEEKAEMLRLK